MKYTFLLLVALIMSTSLLVMSGCDVGVNASFDGETVVVESFDAVVGVIDGQEEFFRYDPNGLRYFTCNPADLYIYRVETGAIVPNQDGSPATCTTNLVYVSDAKTTTIPIFEG